MFDEATYEELERRWKSVAAFFSRMDGLSEAGNRWGKDFSAEHPGNLASSRARHGPKKPLDSTFSQIRRLSLDPGKSDDQAIVVPQVTRG